MDIISGVLKTRKAESCCLQVCMFLIRNLLETTSWKFSISFKTLVRNFVRSSFLVALQTLYCKVATPMKRGFLEISRTVTFRKVPCNSWQSCKILLLSVTLLKSDSTTDALTAIFIILGTNKQRKHLRWSQFSVKL